MLDLSTPKGRNAHIFGDSGAKYKNKQKAARLAEMLEEGLVVGKINKDSIINRYKPACK